MTASQIRAEKNIEITPSKPYSVRSLLLLTRAVSTNDTIFTDRLTTTNLIKTHKPFPTCIHSLSVSLRPTFVSDQYKLLCTITIHVFAKDKKRIIKLSLLFISIGAL